MEATSTLTAPAAPAAARVHSQAAMLPSARFRLAHRFDVTTLHDIRQGAIRQLSLAHLSEREAAAWAELGGIPRVEQAIAKDEVWVVMFDLQVVGWLHRAANS